MSTPGPRPSKAGARAPQSPPGEVGITGSRPSEFEVSASRPSEFEAPELDGARETPWVESGVGGLFFINAVLAAPILMVLFPWTLRWVLRATGALNRPSRVLDPVPAVAAHVAPMIGWLALPAAWLVWRGLQIVDRGWARGLLWIFLALHLGTFVYTVSRWLG